MDRAAQWYVNWQTEKAEMYVVCWNVLNRCPILFVKPVGRLALHEKVAFEGSRSECVWFKRMQR